MDTPTFIAKWSKAQLTEQAASQSHFNDLCALIGVKNPIEADPIGDTFTFEKGAKVSAPASLGSKGAYGRADVWYKGHFAWEYKRKGKYKDLSEAYRQLEQYGKALDNPPLMVVCDIANYEIHTNFTGYPTEVHSFTHDELSDPDKLSLLKRVFTDPDSFKPTETVAAITEKVAAKIGTIAQHLRDREHEPHDAAHFLMKVMFCLFAEDVELLPKGLFKRVLTKSKDDPARLKKQMDQLFDAMRTGGDFGVDEISYFNGGLFDNAESIELTTDEIEILIEAAKQKWSSIEPSILGTLFERSLDPSKRSQIGAHYTSREDIMLVIEPVIVRPLRKQWDEVKSKCESIVEVRSDTARKLDKKTLKKGATLPETYTKRIEKLLFDLQDHLANVRVLDPACGSGNFLYVAIQQLLGLELEIVIYAANIGTPMTPRVRPTQLFGIEINTYASELAQVAIWIGYLQWMHRYGFNAPRDPILEPIDTIENRDAILAWADEDGERISVWREGAKCLGQAKWPEADFIVGNPPFLGDKRMRGDLGDQYVNLLRKAYSGLVPGGADLVMYWFSMLKNQFQSRVHVRGGLLSTNSIRFGANREVLSGVMAIQPISDAWSDREWTLDGAAVRVSITCFAPQSRLLMLDGNETSTISSSLSSSIDTSVSESLNENESRAFVGSQKSGPFDIGWIQAREWLSDAGNPHGKPNIDILRPWANGQSITKRRKGLWIIDYGVSCNENKASQYSAPFEYLRVHMLKKRALSRKGNYPANWWLHGRARPAFRSALGNMQAFIATIRVAKHRLFVLINAKVLPDSRLVAITSNQDYSLGILHSAIHECWSISTASWHGVGNDPTYNTESCFETFSFPWSPGHEPGEGDPQRPLHDAIGECAATLNEQRERWLNPPEWVEPIADRIDAEDDFADVLAVSGEEAQRLIRQSAIDAACAKDPKLKKRTLTNLYNERPTWLRLAHKALDEAVLAAYGAVDPNGDWDTAWAGVFEETGAGQPLPEGHELIERREEVEQLILGNLLRMNQDRA